MNGLLYLMTLARVLSNWTMGPTPSDAVCRHTWEHVNRGPLLCVRVRQWEARVRRWPDRPWGRSMCPVSRISCRTPPLHTRFAVSAGSQGFETGRAPDRKSGQRTTSSLRVTATAHCSLFTSHVVQITVVRVRLKLNMQVRKANPLLLQLCNIFTYRGSRWYSIETGICRCLC